MQKLEMTVTANDWDSAKAILSEVGIDEKSKVNYRTIAGLYIVSVEKNPPLSDAEYIAVRDHKDVSILSDSESRKRVTEVLSKVYDVETQLRKLLLHVSDLVETYFDILKNKYTAGYVDQKSISISGKLDPITSHLTLGQMKDILGYDLSWAKRQLTAQDINDLAKDSTDFTKFKSALNDKLAAKTVWDVIAINVLRCKYEWNDINGDLKKLKDFRDQSAHYQVITDQAKRKLIEKADHLLEMINPPDRKLTKAEEKNLSNAAEALANLAKQIKPITLPENYYQNLLTFSIPAVDSLKFPGVSEALAKAVMPSDQVQKIIQSYGNLFDSYNRSTWIFDDEDDEDKKEDENNLKKPK